MLMYVVAQVVAVALPLYLHVHVVAAHHRDEQAASRHSQCPLAHCRSS